MGFSSSPLLLLLFVCKPFLLPFVCCLNAEGLSLLAFKGSISQDPEGTMANWNCTSQDPCSWIGVTCESGGVVSLSIPKRRLLGSIHPSLGSLSLLRHINLRNNGFSGSLPPELFLARSLQSVVLYGNCLTGRLPSSIGALSFLQVLDLSRNSFSGSLPTSLTQCKRLKTLDLSNNNFTNPLPIGFPSSLLALEKLDISYNEFNGSIPDGIGNLSSLQGTADFSHNLFSGLIPEGLGSLPEMVYIDLSYNNLSGPIPQYGALVNRGPTAFIGNPFLCGPPLKNPCSSGVPSTDPYLPTDNHAASPSEVSNNSSESRSKSSGFTRIQVAAIVVSDVVGICLIAFVFFYFYWRIIASKGTQSSAIPERGLKEKRDCMCFRKDESETISENVEHVDLVSLDPHVSFNLDELLKASAFVLGKSEAGTLYKVVLEDGLILAVRRLGEGRQQRFKEFQNEVEAIGRVRHPNIVSLRAYCWSLEEKLLIYDYIPNGNLSSAIHGLGPFVCQPLSWETRFQIMRETAKALSFLHDFSPKKYVHGELKPTNILLGPHMKPYISDFGVGRLADIATSFPPLQTNGMTLTAFRSSGTCYQAPEALRNMKPSQRWDVYSYGVILLELISGRSPVVLLEASGMELVRWVQLCIEEKKPISAVVDSCLVCEKNGELIGVLEIALACVRTNPERRPSMRSVLDALQRLSNARQRY